MARLPEQRAWDTFKTVQLEGKLKLRRIENMCDEATPDVIGQNRLGTSFWLENKDRQFWPKKITTPVLKNLFQPGQVSFLRNWCQWGGFAFVLARISGEYYLLEGMADFDTLTKREIENIAVVGKEQIAVYLEGLKHP